MSLPPNKNLLAEYPNRWFVETGSWRGDAIQMALDAGFDNIQSMDIDQMNVIFCQNRFDLFRKPRKSLQVWLGDSSEDLWSIIHHISEPITFWLDAHCQMLEGEPEFDHPFPLMHELQQIGMHPIKNHVILVDDILVLSHPDVTGWTLGDIKGAILKINPAYQFKLVANPVKNNLLIAHL